MCYIDGLEPGAVRARAVGEAGVADPPTDRFDVRPASEVYLQSGMFSVEHMTSVLSDNLDQVVAEGSGLLRATGEMPWPGVALQPHGADDFFVYEAALNDVVYRKPARGPDPWPSLTPSELRIAGFVAKGLKNKDIAHRLFVSSHTVDAHLKHMFTKLGIHSRVELTVLTMQHRTPLG